MNFEEIKVGEVYNIRVKVEKVNTGYLECATIDPNGIRFYTRDFYQKEASAFSPIPVLIKSDSYRKFRKGDKVRIIQCKGRDFCDKAKSNRGKVAEVLYDEAGDMFIHVFFPGTSDMVIDPVYLELVTPAEEIEPYRVKTNQYGYHIEDSRKGNVIVVYSDELHPNAFEAAEAECERLNKQHRKRTEL